MGEVNRGSAHGARAVFKLGLGSLVLLFVVGAGGVLTAHLVARSLLSSAAPQPLAESLTDPMLPADAEVLERFADQYTPDDGVKTYLILEDEQADRSSFLKRWDRSVAERGGDSWPPVGQTNLRNADVDNLELWLNDSSYFCALSTHDALCEKTKELQGPNVYVLVAFKY